MTAKPSSKIQPARLLWLGPLTVLASIAGVLIVRVLAVAVLHPDPTPMSLGWVMPTLFTLVLVTGAVLVFAAVARFAKNPIRTYQMIALVFLLLSFIPDIGFARSPMPGANWPNAIALMIMHVAAWAISVTMLVKWSTLAPQKG
jgi:hypothetical protein